MKTDREEFLEAMRESDGDFPGFENPTNAQCYARLTALMRDRCSLLIAHGLGLMFLGFVMWSVLTVPSERDAGGIVFVTGLGCLVTTVGVIMMLCDLHLFYSLRKTFKEEP